MSRIPLPNSKTSQVRVVLCPTTTPVLVQASRPIAFPGLTCILEEDMQRQELCLLNLRGKQLQSRDSRHCNHGERRHWGWGGWPRDSSLAIHSCREGFGRKGSYSQGTTCASLHPWWTLKEGREWTCDQPNLSSHSHPDSYLLRCLEKFQRSRLSVPTTLIKWGNNTYLAGFED